jgi:hypothetical protein
MFIFYIAATHERDLAVMIHSKVRNAYEQKQKEIIGWDQRYLTNPFPVDQMD